MIQILHHPIIRKDLRLVMGEEHTEKKTALPCAFARLVNPHSRGAAMMAIGNVESRNARELRLNDGAAAGIRDGPGTVSHAIFGDEIDFGPFGDFPDY